MDKDHQPHQSGFCHTHSSRREFLRSAAILGGGLSLLGINVAGSIPKDNELSNIKHSRAIQSGKANHFTILYTADIHAQLHTHDELFIEHGQVVYKKRGGFSVLKTMLHQLKAENPQNTIIIDAGDCFQGGGVAALSRGKKIVPLINNIGYDLILPGNWEVVYGKKMMMKDMNGYKAAKICANMFHDENGELIFNPYWTVQIGGTKIGFIGYNDPLTYKRQSPAYSKGIKFTEPEANVARYIRKLRDDEKCSMVFLVTHMGLGQQIDLANRAYVEGADYILGADTHERVRKPIQGQYAKVTEPGSFGSFVARLDFIIEDEVIKDQQYQLLDVDPDRYKPDVEMEMLLRKAYRPYNHTLSKVIGRTKTPLVRYYILETPMDNMITDAIMWKIKPDIALSNGFRFCPPLVPDREKGFAEITNDYLWSMLPVDSQARQATVTGEQLWQWMEKELENVFSQNLSERLGGWVVRFSGMKVNFTMRAKSGERINSMDVKGVPIDLKKNYTVAACEREGDPDGLLCRIENVVNSAPLKFTLHNIILEYLQAFSPISPKIEGRMTATDIPQDLLTQVEGFDYEFR